MDTKVADPLRGALLGGRYRIMGRLARGGMATVYQARDERLERPVAIKIIHPDHVLEAEILDRLAAEAKTVAKLGHPNIVAVFDQGTHEGAPYVVMDIDSYAIAPSGEIAYVGSQLESQPTVEYAGDRESGTYTATLTSRNLYAGTACPGVSTADATEAVRYLVVTVFLNDGKGHLSPLATHTSWITLVKEDA